MKLSFHFRRVKARERDGRGGRTNRPVRDRVEYQNCYDDDEVNSDSENNFLISLVRKFHTTRFGGVGDVPNRLFKKI